MNADKKFLKSVKWTGRQIGKQGIATAASAATLEYGYFLGVGKNNPEELGEALALDYLDGDTFIFLLLMGMLARVSLKAATWKAEASAFNRGNQIGLENGALKKSGN